MMKRMKVAFWLLLIGLAVPLQVAKAQTVTVCNFDCDYTAIQSAINAAHNGDIISLQEQFHLEQDIVVIKNVTIVGQGVNATTVQAAAQPENAHTRVFRVVTGITATFANLTIRHGNAPDYGGGLWNEGGTVTLNNMRIMNNNAAVWGSGVANSGTMVVNNSRFTLNDNFHGAAIYNSGTLTLNNAVVDSNVGSGILNDQTAVIYDSFIGGNRIGISNEGEITVYNSAVEENSTGIINLGQLTLEQSTVLQNDVGLSTSAGETWIEAVTIGNNTIYGMNVDATAQVFVQGSHIESNLGYGIAIYGSAKVEISNTAIAGNVHTFSDNGGGLYIETTDGLLSLTDVTIANNIAGKNGGGLYVASVINTPVSLTNVTISGNSAQGSGGGIYVEPDGELDLANVTITNNRADSDGIDGGAGGGVYIAYEFIGNPISFRNSGVLRAKNSLIANNIDFSPLINDGADCDGDLVSEGYNLIGTLGGNGLDPACDLNGSNTNVVTTTTKLGVLGDNGGFLETHLPDSDSPALDAGDPAGCTDATGQPIMTDQRGAPRPQNGRCDIGAVEGFTIWQDLYLPFIVRN